MDKTTCKKSSVKTPLAKPLGKSPSGDKTLGLELETRFYMLEEVDETAEVEQAEILFIQDSSLVVSKQNLVKSKFPFIDMFNHEGPSVFNAMRDQPRRVFDHLDITSPMDVGK